MRKKPLILLAAAALVVGTGVLLFRRQPVLSPVSVPVTLRYTYGPSKQRAGADEPIFWVTNHTAKELAITLRAIEIQTERGWTARRPNQAAADADGASVWVLRASGPARLRLSFGGIAMQTHVEFRAKKFPAYEGEEEQINPGLSP